MLTFGTDGIRGVANQDLTPEVVLALGRAAARTLPAWRFVVGRDTRRSGPLLEAALVAGLTAEGADVELLGVVPTPAVAWGAAHGDAGGAVISASHNPFVDNGIKLFGPDGRKLPGTEEQALEAELHRLLAHQAAPSARTGDAVGTVEPAPHLAERWLDAVMGSIQGRTLEGLRLVVDGANGAASGIAPRALRRLGADVEVIHAEPDGTNINAGCGSTHPDDLQRAVTRARADAGLAFDGDADRVLAVDHTGALVDGDEIIAITAIDRHQRGKLPGDAVVVTVMTNLGFRLGMAERGIEVVEVPVGDRHVLDALSARGLVLGGEQSGHVVFADLATTGDGLLTALQLLDVVARTGQPLRELAGSAMTKLPQVLRNVRVASRVDALSDRLAALGAEVQAELGAEGRVLIRPSGTEPLVRVMVEARTQELAEAAADRLAAQVAATARS